MLFVNSGLPGLIGDWFVWVLVVNFFIGPAVRTEPAFKSFEEPKEQSLLFFSRIPADGAFEAPLSPSSIFFGNHLVRWSFCLTGGGVAEALFRLAIGRRRGQRA